MNRRGFPKVAGLTIGSSLVTATSYLVVKDESQHPVVDRVPIHIKDLHPALQGFTLLQMSDIHLYPLTQPELIKRSVEIANSLNADLVTLTGDYVWRYLDAIDELVPILSNLNAKMGFSARLETTIIGWMPG